MNRLEPGSPFYNIPLAARLRGPLDETALERTLTEIVRRHETLRTRFVQNGDEPCQEVMPPTPAHIEIIDLQHLGAESREEAALAQAKEEARKPFQLEHGELYRAVVLRLSADDHLMVVIMHHIISDGWSIGVFLREVAALYRAFVTQRSSPLTELAIQYADYSAWQRDRLQGETLDRHLEYWRERLEGIEPLELPTDRPRPARQRFAGAEQSMLLPAELARDLRKLAHGEQATLFMTLLSAFQVLLYRYSSQDDIAVGIPVAGRISKETEGLIGFFANTLVLRGELSGDLSFRRLLRQLKQTSLEAMEHQEIPFEKLVEELNPPRDLSRNPLFQVMFAFQNERRVKPDLAGLKLTPVQLSSEASKFDLVLSMRDVKRGLRAKLGYSVNLFDDSTIERMLEHFRLLLQGVVDDPDRPISQLPWLNHEERHQLLVEWNGADADLPEMACVHQLFEEQVRLRPDTVAVVSEGRSMTYRELNARANQLARHLRDLRVGPESLVAICLERSFEMGVAVLAVLKSGGAYVPLDPDYPRERLEFVVNDSHPVVVLTTAEFADRVPTGDAHLIRMDADVDRILQQSEEDLPCETGLDSAIYVIYTSGSTGRPKGAVNTHRGPCNRLLWEQHYFGFGPNDRVLFNVPLGFDPSFLYFFRPLVCGGRLVIVRPNGHGDPAYLAELIASEGVTIAGFVPSMLRAFVEEESPLRSCDSLRYLSSGGEALTPDLMELVLQRLDVDSYNFYGPTETSIGVIFWKCCRDYEYDTVPIGRPIANVKSYILDDLGNPVPIGVPGELHIGGAAVGRGYLNRPELTAERFIPDPFSDVSEARMYKTGDLCRYLQDGNIEFLGRRDHQVKIRGQRIELGEIEAKLCQHPSVGQATVIDCESVPGDKFLAAYLVTGNSQEGGENARAQLFDDVRRFLKDTLPDYMIPQAFVHLDALPLLPSGKVNRRALPQPDAARVRTREEYVAPRTPLEQQLAAIWCGVLKVKRTGIHDNFFDLGGHSLLATQVISRIRSTLEIELPLRELFRTPTVAGLAEAIQRTTQDSRIPSIQPVSRDQAMPLSFAQQRLWFLDQLAPGSPFYSIPAAVRLSGRLDVSALERALNEVVDRHEVLRTTFAAEKGEPLQRITSSLTIPIPILDLSDLAEEEREDEVRRLAVEEAQTPFDLAVGPLVRAKLVRLGEQEHVMLFNMHHIVSDGWSIGVLMKELTVLYEAFSHGRPSPLEDLPVQYADFAHWQRQWLQDEVLEEQLSYWRQQLADLQTLDLPTDYPRPAMKSYRGTSRRVRLSKDLSDGLKALSDAEEATPFMTLLAAFQVLLGRYTRQDDVAVGTPIAGRNRVEIEGLIGFFVNTLVLRTDLSGNPSFRDLIRRVRDVALGGYSHQDLPFEKLVEELQPDRDMSRTPLFQVLFVFQNAARSDERLSELKLSRLASGTGTSKFDLTLTLQDTKAGFSGTLEYDIDLFDESTIDRMLGHLTTLLDGVVADPDSSIAELPLVGQTERQALLRNGASADVDPGLDVCTHQMFEARAERTPDLVAAEFDGQSLTYEELNRQANRLAHRLRELGVRPDDPVGICLERGLQLAVGVLGILKAGGAYLPLDPTYPAERLRVMLEDARPPIVVTQQSLQDDLPKSDAAQLLVDADDDIGRQPVENPELSTTCRNLAFVLYTSGSTGTPKGVAMEHRPLVNLIKWQLGESPLGEGARTLQFASLNFDVSFHEMFATWCSGGTLVLTDESTRRDMDQLLRFLKDHRIQRIFVPFVVLQQLAELGSESETSSAPLEEIITAGEQLHVTPQVVMFFDKLEDCQFHNHYGPTEAHVVTAHTLQGAPSKWPALPPIGRPIANTQIYLLDDSLQPVPVGVPGELYIGGVPLARGYLNRPDLTAERFVADPFSEDSDARMYKSSDWARWLPDGNIEFLGRADEQVKFRGFRIEVGEIEVHLGRHPIVHDSAVMVKSDTAGRKRLVAYVVADENSRPSVSDLREFLGETLPDYMVPTTFVFLDAFPLTVSGKLNRRALPAPDDSRPELAEEYVAPLTPVETQLAAIWSEVLGVERVGVQDSFFSLGGHSLLATQVVSRIREAFQVELALRELFRKPTIAGLAEAIARTAQELQTPPITPVGRDQPLAPSFSQQRLWLLDQLQPGNPAYNMPAAVRLSGRLDVTAVERSLNEIVRRHEVLRTTLPTVDGQPLQQIAPHLELSIPVVDLSTAPSDERDAEVQRLATEEARQPFDLAGGPLVRAKLLRLGDQEHVALFAMHHVVSDGWSMAVLVREFGALYGAYSRGQPSPLEELPIQYADFAHWQQAWLDGKVLDEQLDYWKKQLADLPSLELPTDRPRPAVQTFQGERCEWDISEDLWRDLKSLSDAERVTPFMTLLAALQLLLSRYSGQEDIAVGTPIAGRNRAEVEGLIGCFLNTLVLRTDLSGNPAFRDLLARVRDVALGAYAHQDLPFEKLLDELQPERDLSRTPLFQVFLNMVNLERPRLDLKDLVLETLPAPEPMSKFDMTLYVHERRRGAQLRLVYNADVFDPPRMRFVLHQYEHVLRQIVDAPHSRFNEISLITADCHALLPDPCASLEEPQYEPVTETIEAIASSFAEHPAMTQGGAQWNYGQLWSRAEHLARTLCAHGTTPGEVVAVTGPKSFGLITAMLGIELSGSVLMPLDPDLPRERHETMLRQAEAKTVVVVRSERDVDVGETSQWPLETLTLDADEGQPQEGVSPIELAEVELPRVSPESPAYVFFTSGSTGQPKGILGSHKGLSHFLAWQRKQFEIGTQDRVAQLTSLSFDVVLRDVFLPLTSGATLCLPERDDLAASGQVIPWLEHEGITVLHAVPTLIRYWLGLAEPGRRYQSVRWLFSAGEPLTDSLVRSWRDVYPGGQIVNLYGPTETTMVKCFHIIPEEPASGVQPVGRPLPHTQALVVRSDGQRCAVGEPGQIVLRTPFRTLGYLNPKDCDAGGFVSNPFRNDPSDVVYRTGDGGRYRPDGLLEILGRLDDQVKIRGVRVEPSEVAAVLARHPQVRTSAVLSHQDDRDQYYLAAYVVPATDAAGVRGAGQSDDQVDTPPDTTATLAKLTGEELQTFLNSQLPPVMVPSAFTFLESMPLLPNGKVDRRALPKSEPTVHAQEYVPARNPDEEHLADIWSEVLGVEQVGIHDNFFALGGHSLLATQVMSRITRRTQVELPLRELFRSPTVAGLAERIQAARALGPSVTRPPIVPTSREGHLPLSFTQEALWFLDRLEPLIGTYSRHRTLRVRGALDLDALQRAVDEIVRRHETLRTRFPAEDGRPTQVISPPGPGASTVVDISHFAEEEREAEMRRWLQEETQRPIDLENGPLLSVMLLRLSEDDHVAVVATHHIIYDGWSMGVLIRELAVLYRAYRDGRPSPLPELPIQYADFAVWQRQFLQGDNLERLRNYWGQQLADVLPLDVPTDYPRPSIRSTRGDSRAASLSPELSTAVRDFSRDVGATPFMTLLAAFQLLLGRYGGQDDVAVGSPVANRTQPELEPMIGYFINMLVFRTRLSGDFSFRDLVEQVRQTVLDGFDHQDLTLNQVVDVVNPPRDTSRHPLFQAMFILHNFAPSRPGSVDLRFQRVRGGRRRRPAYFELNLVYIDTPRGFRGGLSFSADLFAAETIERMAEHYRMLLTDALADPDRPLSELPLVSDQERHELLIDWNSTDSEDVGDACIHEVFEEQVARAPDAVAVVDGPRQWTYDELNREANRLAHYLRDLGVEADGLVAVRLPRSAELIAVLWAVLKAGGAYLPLDPQLPADRLRLTLEDGAVDVVVTETSLEADLPDSVRHVVCVDRQREQIESRSDQNPMRQVSNRNLAYVIYTSGSTGRPKGVMIEHQALVAYTRAATAEYGITSVDRVLQFASVSYDGHVEEVYPVLTQGGTLILRTDDMLDSREFFRQCQEQRVTVLSLPTSFWHELVSAIELDGFAVPDTLRFVCFGGEKVMPERVAAWFDNVGTGVRLSNTYGPTETTVVSTSADLESSDGQAERVPIGRPLANTRVYVLDAHLRPVPIGVRGELYVGGQSVARGYLNRPDLTHERFVPDPFVESSDACMYKTGDQVRWRSDGRLEFVGRVDQQVKIRGFRIEPGEVEHLLREHPSLAEAAVVARERNPGVLQLVAYVVGQNDQTPTIPEMRGFLAKRVPEFMIPSAFVVLDQLPTTTSGKVDRKSLPEPDWSRSGIDADYVAPRTDHERQLAEIWANVLSIEQVGIRDNFFDLGGHSLLATQLVSRINREFEVWIPLRDLFETPTIEGLAQRILAARESGARASLPAIQPASRDGHPPLSYGQEALWLISQIEQGPSAYTMHPTARVRGPIDHSALERALNEILRRHESLRTTFTEEDGHPVQIIAPHTPYRLPVVDLSEFPAEDQRKEVRRYVRSQMGRPMDLSQGPLAQVELLKLNDNEHVVMVGMHHIIYDGWSLAVLRRELLAAYRAFAAGQPSPLTELPVQYADYAIWQRERLEGELLDRLKTYWLKQLANLPTLDLPTDKPRPPVRTTQAISNRCRLSAELTAALNRLAQDEGATTFMILMAALQVLLNRYSGQTDFAVGTPVAGRLRPEMENLIGYFVNTLVLRANLAGEPTFRELVDRVRETALQAFDHQELPFERLVQELRPRRDISRHPVFQTLFVLQNTPREKGQRGESARPQSAAAGSPHSRSDFDLVLSASETSQGIRLHLHGNRDLFEEATITRMLEHFQVLLHAAVGDPDRRVSQLPLLTDQERDKLLLEWNRTEVDFPELACVHQLFEKQARLRPDTAAAVFEGQTLTYRELNARANRLAHYLQGLGVKPESLVGICLERSLDMAVALLAVLKSGGAYVPLDPDHPRERLDFVVNDSHPIVVLTTAELADRVPSGDARSVRLDADANRILHQSEEDLPCETDLDSAVYVIYTSGSTGSPKGAVNVHRGPCNRLLWELRYYEIGPSDRVLFKTPLSFDPSFMEFFRPLVCGGRLVIARPDGHGDPAYLAELIARERITMAAFVPSLLRAFVEEEQIAQGCDSLRWMTSGGEALTRELLELALQRFDADFYNVYGPTETSIAVTCWKCRCDYGHGTIPIGRPIANVKLYIVDDSGNPVPIGVPGELCVGGVAVGRGYLNRPELTAERFIPDPFSDVSGARLYKTGDLCRYLPDGNVEFLGRRDHQVKIRGYRVELGEIESALREHPAVKQASVVLRENRPGECQLVAYFVREEDQALERGQLRAYLISKVPRYMLPAAYIPLESLPLTSSGKVDRRALPTLDDVQPDVATVYVAPRNELESQLAGIWADVLSVEKIGIQDNFFDVGGHSLLATQAISRINRELHVHIPLRDLFESPTIEDLTERIFAAGHSAAEDRLPLSYDQDAAWLIEQVQEGKSPIAPSSTDRNVGRRQSLVRLRSGGSESPLFCIHGLGGDVTAFVPLARLLAEQRSVFALQAQGLDQGQQPHDRIEDMAAFYSDEIRETRSHGPYLLAGWSMGGIVALEVAHQLTAAGEPVDVVAMFDTHLSSTGREVEEADDAAVMRWIAPQFGVPRSDIRGLPVEKQWELVAERAKLAEGIGVAQIRRLAEACKAHLAASSRYMPKPYDGPVVLFRVGSKQGPVSKRWKSLHPQLRVEEVPGDHYSMLREPHVEKLAELLGPYLPEDANVG